MQRRIMAQKFLPAIIGIFIVAMTIVSCQDEKKNVVPSIANAQEIPTMVTRDVETFISDSGITRYHITAKLWNIYEEAKDGHSLMVFSSNNTMINLSKTLRCCAIRLYISVKRNSGDLMAR